jgi:ribonuclease HI
VAEGAGPYVAHTDGACLGNPDGPGGWAAAVESASESWDLWGHLSSTTNNRAEALGVLAALEWTQTGAALLVRSDSELTVRILEGRYKARKNPDIWLEINRLRSSKGVELKTEWVRGHVGDPGNERADYLSRLGATDGDVEAAGRIGQARPAAKPLPSELVGLVPQGDWEKDFLQSVARQLRTGRALSLKQQAIVERMRARSDG